LLRVIFKYNPKNCPSTRLLRATFKYIPKSCSSTRMFREKGKISKKKNELGKVMPNL
jgi:hypothetical protein